MPSGELFFPRRPQWRHGIGVPVSRGTDRNQAVFLCSKFSLSLCRAGWSIRKDGQCDYWYANFIRPGT